MFVSQGFLRVLLFPIMCTIHTLTSISYEIHPCMIIFICMYNVQCTMIFHAHSILISWSIWLDMKANMYRWWLWEILQKADGWHTFSNLFIMQAFLADITMTADQETCVCRKKWAIFYCFLTPFSLDRQTYLMKFVRII